VKIGTYGIYVRTCYCNFIFCKFTPVAEKLIKTVFPVILLILFSAAILHAFTPVIIDENAESASFVEYAEKLKEEMNKKSPDPDRGRYDV